MPVHKEIKEPVLEVVPTIEQTGKEATKNANAGLDQLKSEAQTKQYNLAAVEFQKSENKTIAELGRAAEGFIAENNFDDASLALGMAELLTQTGELNEKYTESWKSDFESYTQDITKQMKKGLTDENRKQAYITMSVVVNNISNASRLQKLEYFEKKAESPKYRKTTKNFVLKAVEGAKTYYDQGKMEEGDKILAYLTYYTDTILKKGIKGKEGRGAIENAIKTGLKGDWEKSDKLFQKSIKDYGVTMAAKQLWTQYAKLESNYLMASDTYGKDIILDIKLKKAKKALDNRQVNKAFKLLNEFSKGVNEHIEDNMLANLDNIQKDLKATPEVMESYEEGVKPYAQEFPEEVKKIVGKLEKVSNKSVELLDESQGIEKDYKKGKKDEKKTKKFFSDLEDFSKDRKEAIGTASAGVLLMGNMMSEKQFKQIMKMGNVDYVRKEEVMKQSDIALENMDKSLDLIIKEGPESKKAKDAYEKAVYAKTGALAILDLERLEYGEEEKKFEFFSEGSMKVYDACTKGEATSDVWKLNNTLFDMESAVISSDDKLFATKEAVLQQEIISQGKILAGHYTAKIDGEKALVLDNNTVASYEFNMGKNIETLGKKIENAEKINMGVKLAASFIHPSLFIATSVEMACKEYEVTGAITWQTGLMLAASALAFRQMALFKGLSFVKGGAAATKIAKFGVTGVELGIGGVLMAHGAAQTYHAFKNGQYEEGALSVAMFAVPLFYAAARKPMMTALGKKVPKYRQFSGELVSEGALSKQTKKFGVMDAVVHGKKGYEKVKAKGAVAMEQIKIGVKGSDVALAPMPLMISPKLIQLGQKAVKAIAKPFEKPIFSAMKNVTTGNKSKYAKGINKLTGKQGKVGARFYDTVVQNGKTIEKSLAEVRKEVTYKDDNALYKALQNEADDSAKILAEYAPGKDLAKEQTNFGFLSIDKGKTWELNNIGKEFGDIGLYVYFKAAKNLEGKKFAGKAAESIRATEKGDEIIIIFSGKNTKKAMNEYKEAYAAEVKNIAKELGFEKELLSAVTEFDAVPVEATATLKEGKVQLSTEIKGQPKIMKLESMISTAEAAEKLTVMESKGMETAELWKFIELTETGPVKGSEKIKSIETLPKKTKLDNVVSFRIKFGEKTEGALFEMTNTAGKGVSHVDNGIVGPSVLNQLGHPVTDYFSAKYHVEFAKNLKKLGVKAKTYSHGPMSIGVVGKVKPELLEKAIAETNKAMAKDPNVAKLGIEMKNVEAFVGKDKDMANYGITKKVIGYEISNPNYEKMKNLVTILHLSPDEMIAKLETEGVSSGTVKLFKSIKKENVKWVRTPEDLVHYLRKSASDKEIMTAFDALGIKLGKKLPGPKAPPAPKAPVEKGPARKGPAKAAAAKKKFETDEKLLKKAYEKPKVEVAGSKISDKVLMYAEQPHTFKTLITEFENLSKKDRALAIEYAKSKGPFMKGTVALLQDFNTILEHGDKIAKAYGVKKKDLINVYKQSISADDAVQMMSSGNTPYSFARAELRDLLGIDIIQPAVKNPNHPMAKVPTLDHDNLLWGILTDGELLVQSNKLGGKITKIEYKHGLLGAYEFTIKTKKGTEKVYLKKINQEPAKLGADVSKISGSPAPDVIATGKYYDAERGVMESYGVLENIVAAEGEILLGGQKVKYKVHEATDFQNMYKKIGPSESMDTGIPSIGKNLSSKKNVQSAKEAYGDAFASAIATGTVDRHDENMFFMKLELVNANKKTVDGLKAKGYPVATEGNKHFLYKFGGIDLDTALFYSLKIGADGKPNIGAKSLSNSSYFMIEEFYKLEHNGKTASLGSPQMNSYMKEFFAPNSPFMKGVEKWIENSNTPEFKSAMTKAIDGYEGKVGLGNPLAKDTYYGMFGGEVGAYSTDALGRFPLLKDVKRILTKEYIKPGSELESAGVIIDSKAQKTKSGFIISMETMESALGKKAISELGGAEISYSGKKFFFLPTEAMVGVMSHPDPSVPKKFNSIVNKHYALKISKAENLIETYDPRVTSLKKIMPEENSPYYLVPVKEGIKPKNPKNVVNLGFIESKNFEVFKKLPEGVEGFEVQRLGDSIITKKGKNMGVKTMETGQKAAFESIMNMDMNDWNNEIILKLKELLTNPILIQ